MQRAEHGSGSARSGAPPAAAAAAAAVAMSSDFESYEQDFAVLTADITGRIGKVPKLLGGEPGGERGLGKEPGWQGRAGRSGGSLPPVASRSWLRVPVLLAGDGGGGLWGCCCCCTCLVLKARCWGPATR